MIQSYRPIIRMIEDDYEIPQLGRNRRISALLPYDYETSDRSYPVLYLHDGQNLFNEKAVFGNWAIDESLAQLASEGIKDLIIIAIDHGGEERLVEYLPYKTKRFGQGVGPLYLQFLLETLKPYVDQQFRVLPGRAHTGIGGSSMGGLISLYAGLTRPEIFSKMMVFSPSLWLSPKVFEDISRFAPPEATDLYVYAGGKESPNHLLNVRRMQSLLFRGGKKKDQLRFHLSINPEGKHSEAYWRAEFPLAVRWLFFPTT